MASTTTTTKVTSSRAASSSQSSDDHPNDDNVDTKLVVVSRYHPGELAWSNGGDGRNNEQRPVLSADDERNDSWDEYNHPRYRRVMILTELAQRTFGNRLAYFTTPDRDLHHRDVVAVVGEESASTTTTKTATPTNLHAYLRVHSPDLIDFLETSWKRWDELKDVGGQDPNSSIPVKTGGDGDGDGGPADSSPSPPLIPGNTVLHRDSCQRPSKNVMGQIGYYCTDTCTPILAELLDELLSDQQVTQIAVRQALSSTTTAAAAAATTASSPPVVYALTTHPGHHAARDSFGGYCYVNHAALAARLLQEQLSEQRNKKESSNEEDGEQQQQQHRQQPRVAVLDVDYHCGNGTASIFYDDASVVVISIHCHPDHEYPFHSGFEDERGGDSTSSGATLHLPLLPGANWTEHYRPALQKALDYLFDDDNGDNNNSLGPIEGLVVSLGLDTLKGDPCAIRRAGFQLTTSPESSEDSHYLLMGKMIGEATTRRKNQSQQHIGASTTAAGACIPCVVIQEGGYKMDEVPIAAADVLTGIVEARNT